MRRQLLAQANRARNRRQDRRAIALYRRILLEEPRNAEVALRLAPLLALRGEAFEAWQLLRMAVLELRRERREEACLSVLREACRLVPHEYDAWRMRAELELKFGRDELAYDTLLEGRRQFARPDSKAQAMALLTRARAIEPWDTEVALDLAGLYVRSGLAEAALELLASLAGRVRASELRRVRGLQWRITLSPQHARLWLRSIWAEHRDATSGVAPLPDPSRSGHATLRRPPADDCLPLTEEVSV
jgi:thioredoxin-like negative regulator of GroEL